ncbi:1-alkyl-2-acetylglycerophosphocholine esterase [Aspergillus terreus]|uniref:1-alkyl-2-acetylglycerophosphocholine esterase n=1 Tax=Aspergillus terreus TaxID=33178 RepID=A0A5M3ZE31_ASPTE|nr:hypothetical protein ATETN484_0017016300 [Aspergillus terreus]GFF21834.1 1-alkyl-2-acetylglycerophosphocholine esterase [Aspergillus terreus]
MANSEQETADTTLDEEVALLRQLEADDPDVDCTGESSRRKAEAEGETQLDAQSGEGTSRQERGSSSSSKLDPSAILDAAKTNLARFLELDLTGVATYISLRKQKRELLKLLVANSETTSEILFKVFMHMKRSREERSDKAEHHALSLALTQGRADLARTLLENGVALVLTHDSGHSALCHACRHRQDEIVSLLLDKGADLNKTCDHEGDTPLGVACYHGHEQVVALLLADSRIDIDKKDNTGWTPLNTAALGGYTKIVAKLLAEGADINIANNLGWTPLATACCHGFEEIVSFLLAREDIMIDTKDEDGCTPLNTAAQMGRASIISRLLNRGAAIDIASDSEWMPLQLACSQGHMEAIEALLRDKRTDINGRDSTGWTPLLAACRNGQEEVVNYLLKDKEIDINRMDDVKWTPLRTASRYGHAAVVDILLANGAHVNPPDAEGWTALMGACKWGHYEISQQLLDHHADVNVAHHEQWTALHWASHGGHANLVTLLLRYNADRSARNQDGCTPLHLASQQGYEDTVRALLDQPGGMVDAGDNEGWTALHKASFYKDSDAERLDFEWGDVKPDSYHEPVSQHHRVVMLLMEHNANITSTTTDGATPLLLAAKKANTRCLELLVVHMAENDLNQRDSDGCTALYYAAKARDVDLLRLLLGSVRKTDFGAAGTEMEREILAWAAEDGERHQIFAAVAQKGSLMAKKNVPDTHRESALCWAAWNADLDLVCRILNSNASDLNSDKVRKSVEAVASRMLSSMKSEDAQRGRNTQIKSNTTKQTARKAQKDGNHRRKEQPTASAAERDNYETILDLLRNPPIVPTTVSIQPCEMPVLGADIDISAFDAAVVDFYANEKSSGFLRRERGVREVIYDPEEGLARLMAAAQEQMEAQSDRLGTSNVFSPGDFNCRWIHLPANNIQWMNDLMSRIYFEKKTDGIDRIYGDLNKFFRRSWHQVPDASSRFRFMKPECVMQDKKGGDTSPRLALYMPYLTFATYPHKQPSSYQALLNTYSKTAIHQFRTLDESYYQFTSDDADEERERRNKDQVVTRTLFNNNLEEIVSWDLVGVEQLWLWIVDDKTVITSSTHRADGRSNVVQASVLDRLTELGHGENKRSQPATALELSKFIVDTCVQFYSRTKYSPTNIKQIPNPVAWSIRQFFSDSVNRAAVKEAGLFKQFSDKGLVKAKSRRGHQHEDFNSVKDIYVQQTASLLTHVKDMRDELNMIKAIVSDQEAVQCGLYEKDCSAAHIISDLEEMDRATQRVYEAVEATLTLEQNVIALTQSEETVQQGRILMAFTVATIIFLPMSFLVSLFAVDITAFPHNRSGELQYTSGWIFPIIFGISAVVWISPILCAFRSQVLRSVNTIAQRFPASQNLRVHATKAPGGNTSAADLRTRFGNIYLSKTNQLRQRFRNKKSSSGDEEAQKGELDRAGHGSVIPPK